MPSELALLCMALAFAGLLILVLILLGKALAVLLPAGALLYDKYQHLLLPPEPVGEDGDAEPGRGEDTAAAGREPPPDADA